ncbi:unnamed protein product [Caenorhabditis angaria]|uniref:RRM domain-containing protein n=1 Tax=Caenorhabditis angaria TaxID=860376 RepID=A0A9P1IYX8_9PELO|nr:unnamed protein product [Caenorhabditis angaria]
MFKNNNEPTLLAGDLNPSLNFDLLVDFVCNKCAVKPVEVRFGTTRDSRAINIFFQYRSYEEGMIVRRNLNGQTIPGLSENFKVRLDFTKCLGEVTVYITCANYRMTTDDIEFAFSKYKSMIGSSGRMHKDEYSNRNSCFLRFLDKEEAIQAVTEMNAIHHLDSLFYVTFSARYIDDVINYVNKRENDKIEQGIMPYHNYYTKKQLVSVDEANEIYMSQDADLQNDLDASRWSWLPYHTTTGRELQTSLNYDFFQNL